MKSLLPLTRRIQKAISATYQAAQPDGIPLVQVAVLSALAANGSLSQRQISETADIDRSSLSKMLASMDGNGFIERHRGADRRVVKVSITQSGRYALTQHIKATRQVEKELMARLPARERVGFLNLMERIAG